MRSSIGRNSGKVCHRGVLANSFVVELVRLGVTPVSDVDGAMNLATLHRQQNIYFIYIRGSRHQKPQNREREIDRVASSLDPSEEMTIIICAHLEY